MKKTLMTIAVRQLAFLLPLSFIPSLASAQGDIYRADTWDFSVRLVQQMSFDVNAKGGSKINAEDKLGFGIDFGYHFNSHIRLGMSFDYINPDYRSTIILDDGLMNPIEIDYDMDMWDTQVNLTYNLINGPLTPFVKAGLGWTYVDTNVADGPPQTVCWWDPWWGYVCSTSQSSYDDWLFAYSLAVGLRWEVQDSLFFSASYQEQWLDFKNSNGSPSIGRVFLEVGFNY